MTFSTEIENRSSTYWNWVDHSMKDNKKKGKKNSFAAYRLPIFLQNPLLAKGAGNTAFWPILSDFVMTSIQTHTLV